MGLLISLCLSAAFGYVAANLMHLAGPWWLYVLLGLAGGFVGTLVFGLIGFSSNSIISAAGSGKTYIACALGIAACRKFMKVRYVRLPELLDELAISRVENQFKKVSSDYGKADLLILDDWLLKPLTKQEAYDLATAFETIYFWQGLERCFAEVFKVLKPGGCFMIVNESDGLDEGSKKFEKMIEGMKLYTAEDIEKALKSAGFSEVKTDHHESKPWITVLAQK